MAKPNDQDSVGAGLVFAAFNAHHERCGAPPRLRNTDSPGLYYGYFENGYGEQFVFTFDRATGTGTVWVVTSAGANPRRSLSDGSTRPSAAPRILPRRSRGVTRDRSCR